MLGLLFLNEAIASVALSHDDDCVCDTCRAAAGDKAALDRVLTDVLIEMREREEAGR